MLNIFYYKLLYKYSDNVINLNKTNQKLFVYKFVSVIIRLIA